MKTKIKHTKKKNKTIGKWKRKMNSKKQVFDKKS